jgi:hypothetical protein
MPDDVNPDSAPDLEAVPNPDGLIEALDEMRAAGRQNVDVAAILADDGSTPVSVLNSMSRVRTFGIRSRSASAVARIAMEVTSTLASQSPTMYSASPGVSRVLMGV